MRQNALAGRALKLAVIALLATAIFSLLGCFYMPGLTGGHGTAKARVAADLPYNVTGGITLIIGGPGMETIVRQFDQGTTTSGPIAVPSGVARTFTLLANTASVTLMAQHTIDLSPGETRDITLDKFVAGGSQIIVPDYFNNRLVQTADMVGTGWTQKSEVAGAYDVDYDDQGRLYVASGGNVYLMDDIGGAISNSVSDQNEATVLSVAVDRAHDLVYFTDSGNFLMRFSITPTTVGAQEEIHLEAISVGIEQTAFLNSVTGIAVDSDGFVYIANTPSSNPSATILKINPNPATNPTLVASASFAFTSPGDVLVKGDYIYVSDHGSNQIVRLTKSLAFVDAFSGPASDPLLGPERFVAILNKPITVIDEDASGERADRLVAFDDMTGAGWTTLPGNPASGSDVFMFYSS